MHDWKLMQKNYLNSKFLKFLNKLPFASLAKGSILRSIVRLYEISTNFIMAHEEALD